MSSRTARDSSRPSAQFPQRMLERLQVGDDIVLPLARTRVSTLRAVALLDRRAFLDAHKQVSAHELDCMVTHARRALVLDAVDALSLPFEGMTESSRADASLAEGLHAVPSREALRAAANQWLEFLAHEKALEERLLVRSQLERGALPRGLRPKGRAARKVESIY